MHINNWVHASDLMKMIKSANSTSTLSSEEGLPDNHVITIRERELTVDFPELIQNNIKTDTVTLDLDAEWDGIQPVIIFGPNASGTIAVEYTGEPVHIPGAVMQYVGGLDCSVMGLDDSGEVRLVTKAAPNTFEVVESGEYIGQISEDDVSLLGQILSAIKDVETATSDASSAAEAATAAANSANTAATKATTAANTANTAATKATDAANSANTASERAENAYDALTPIIAEIGVNGNQPRATTNPNRIATASDAYAAKPLEICIKGNTRQNLWVNPSGTLNGLTATADSGGSVTVKGTSTGLVSLNSGKKYILKPSTKYTFSVDNKLSDNLVDPSNGSFFIEQVLQDDSDLSAPTKYIGYGNTLSVTFTTHEELSCVYMGVYSVSGKTFSGTYRVMLNEGSTAEPWCPPGLSSVDELSVVTAGKNQLTIGSPHATTGSESGIEFTLNDDGSVRCVGNLTGSYANTLAALYDSKISDLPGAVLDAGTYYYETVNGSNDGYMITVRLGDLDNENAHIASSVRGTFNLSKRTRVSAYLVVGNGPTGDIDVTVWCTITRVSAVGEKLPAATTTEIDLDGHTLCSLPDGTCDELTIDATGAVTLVKRVGVFEATEDTSWTEYNGPGNVNAYYTNTGMDAHSPTGDTLDAVDTKMMCDDFPCYQTLWHATSATPRVGMSDNAAYPNVMFYNSAGYGPAASDTRMTVLYPLATPQTIPLTSVTLPTLPSPNITVYHDSDVPSDITVEYVQDINIVFDNLNAKIAALNIAQSISS